MRLLHSADLHLDSPLRAQALRNPVLAAALRDASRRALARLVDLALHHRVDALLLAGDIFDSHVADLTTRAALAAQLGRLDAAGIPAVMIRGNHDALLDHDRFGPVSRGAVLLGTDRPTVHVRDAAIHGLGFESRHHDRSLLPGYPAPEPGRVNIGLMHTSLDGAAGHDRYAPCASADLLGFGYDYWALGHIHARFERRGDRALAVMPGIPQGRSIREPGQGSATLVQIGTDGLMAQAVPVAALAFVVVQVDLDGAADQATQVARMAQALHAAALPDCDVAARLVLSGAPMLAAAPDFARDLAQQAAEQVAGLHVDAVRFAATAPAPPEGAIADLARMMRADAATPGFRDEADAVLADWRSALPRDIADALDASDRDTLIEQGLAMVTAALGRRGED